jgi:class 3 adenylate cyclase
MSEAVDTRRRARLGPAARLARSLGLGDQPGDSGDIRILRRAMAILAVFTIVASNIWVAMGIVLDSPIVVWTSVAYIVVVLAALVAHARTRWLFGFIAVFAASGLLITLIGDLTLGGIRAGAGSLIWGFLVPIGALVYFGTRGSLFWFGAFAAMVVAAMLLDPLVTASAFAMPYPLELAFNAFNLLGASAVVFALLAYVNGQRREAQARSEELLLNVLPAAIADRLKGGERVIADQYPAASVLFADLVEFTPMSERVAAPQVVNLLNDLFSAFDGIAETQGLEKIKTIGDAYMAVAGVPEPRPDHAGAAVEMGLAMVATAHGFNDPEGRPLELRVGIASGPVVAGVIGRRKFIYDLWGDTVNTASRMESSGMPGCLQITLATRDLLDGRYRFEERTGVEVKGKGIMTTYVMVPAVGVA